LSLIFSPYPAGLALVDLVRALAADAVELPNLRERITVLMVSKYGSSTETVFLPFGLLGRAVAP
jgi:hypothetical protein